MALVNSQVTTDQYSLFCADCFDVVESMPSASIDFSIFSPPFVDLFCYSSSERDLGNCTSYEEFFVKFSRLAKALQRIIKPGRLCAVHCIDIPAMKERDGYIGLKDFPGDIIRALIGAGFIYHSRHTIWKDPLIEATRTKALGLMHKQLCKDSAMSRAGLPDYLLAFRNTGENAVQIAHPEGLSKYCGGTDPRGNGVGRSHNIWRAYASPVWMDIRQTNVISFKEAREHEDEKHICPLQIDVIERACVLWSNPGEVVLTPFMGVGSECYGAVLNDRKAIGIELQEKYYVQAIKNMESLANKAPQQIGLF